MASNDFEFIFNYFVKSSGLFDELVCHFIAQRLVPRVEVDVAATELS